MQAAVVPLPAVEKLPAAHSPLPLELTLPARQYLPPGHALQDALVPLPAVEKLPAEHKPLPLDTLHPDRQYLPAGQGRQTSADADPISVLYVPAGQGMQVGVLPLPMVE